MAGASARKMKWLLMKRPKTAFNNVITERLPNQNEGELFNSENFKTFKYENISVTVRIV